MSIESVQIIGTHQKIVATARVEYNEKYYSGSVNLDRMPQLLLSQFEEFESIVNGQILSLIDKIYEQVQSTSFIVVFDDGRKFAIEDLQIYPIEGLISFWID